MKKIQKTNQYFSRTWGVQVRPSIAREFTANNFFDDNLAGLHEIRVRRAKKIASLRQTVAQPT